MGTIIFVLLSLTVRTTDGNATQRAVQIEPNSFVRHVASVAGKSLQLIKTGNSKRKATITALTAFMALIQFMLTPWVKCQWREIICYHSRRRVCDLPCRVVHCLCVAGLVLNHRGTDVADRRRRTVSAHHRYSLSARRWTETADIQWPRRKSRSRTEARRKPVCVQLISRRLCLCRTAGVELLERLSREVVAQQHPELEAPTAGYNSWCGRAATSVRLCWYRDRHIAVQSTVPHRYRGLSYLHSLRSIEHNFTTIIKQCFINVIQLALREDNILTLNLQTSRTQCD